MNNQTPDAVRLSPLRRLGQDFSALTPSERRLWRAPIMWAAALAILLIPVIYVSVYLASVWDPYGNLSKLPAALVNADAGTTFQGQRYDLGARLVKTLHDDPPVKFVAYPSEAAAQAAVRRGEVYFALSIPADFSRKALAGSSTEHGLLHLYSAEGTSYFASRVSASVTDKVAAGLNASLGDSRWDKVQKALVKVEQGFGDIRSAAGQLRDGADQLVDGSTKLSGGASRLAAGTLSAASGGQRLALGAHDLSGGVGQLTSGVARLSGGVRQLSAAAPGPAQLKPLQDGAAVLGQGSDQLAGGMKQLSAGADKLAASSAQLTGGAEQLSIGAGQLAAGLPKLGDGAGQFQQGAAALSGGAGQLAGGLKQLGGGSQQLAASSKTLAAGAGQVNGGAQQLAHGLPTLTSGLGQLQTGAGTLTKGVGQLGQSVAELKAGVPAAPTLDPVKAGLQQLQGGVSQLQNGSGDLAAKLGTAADAGQKLSAGATTLAAGTAKLNAGSQQLQAGAATLAQKTAQAQAAAATLATGTATLAERSGGLQSGAQQLSKGATTLATGAAKLATASQQLQQGAATLAQKTGEARSGAQKLASGAASLGGGLETLVAGNLKLKSALGSIEDQLPAQSDLNNLSGGASTLARKSGDLASGLEQLVSGAQALATGSSAVSGGSVKLRDGLEKLYAKIPTHVQQLGGDPQGLSASVLVVSQKAARVANNGTAFAPYFVTLSLWVGCTLTTFIFPFLLIPESGRRSGQAARVLRKFAVPGVYVVAQAIVVVLGIHLLGTRFLHPVLVVFTAVASSLTFMLLVLALNLLLGAAGRLLALVLLVVQLAASGGTYPVELSSLFFQVLHAIVPVTDAINAMRFALFGSYDGQYGLFMTRLGAVALFSLAVALLSRRRWLYVPDERFRSPLLSDVG